jgi:integrase
VRVTQLNKLKDARLRSLGKGLHSDGGGLYLSVAASGARSWIFIWRGGGRRREMGLGGYPTVSLAEARRRAAEARALRARNLCPLAEKRSTAPAALPPTTFRTVAQATVDRLSPGWRGKTRAQWERSLFKYAAALGPLTPAEIDTGRILSVLRPLWEHQHASAQKCRAHLEAVLDTAKVMGLRTGENPARWDGNLKHLLPPVRRLVEGHHRALAYDHAPPFWRALNARTGIPERLLEFILLTAVRYSEAAGARWDEIDGDVWTVPADRMKGKRPHAVPLSPAALAVLERVRGLDEDLVFGHRISAPTVYARLEALGVADQTTVHGLRSTFRDWGGNETTHAREVLEAALAHVVGSEVERAYRRGDALEKRRSLMADWADYLSGAQAHR